MEAEHVSLFFFYFFFSKNGVLCTKIKVISSTAIFSDKGIFITGLILQWFGKIMTQYIFALKNF